MEIIEFDLLKNYKKYIRTPKRSLVKNKACNYCKCNLNVLQVGKFACNRTPFMTRSGGIYD